MALVRKDTESIRVLDDLRLPEVPNQSPTVVNLYHVEGHVYYKPMNIVSGDSTLNLGNLGRMCKFPETQGDEGYVIA